MVYLIADALLVLEARQQGLFVVGANRFGVSSALGKV